MEPKEGFFTFYKKRFDNYHWIIKIIVVIIIICSLGFVYVLLYVDYINDYNLRKRHHDIIEKFKRDDEKAFDDIDIRRYIDKNKYKVIYNSISTKDLVETDNAIKYEIKKSNIMLKDKIMGNIYIPIDTKTLIIDNKIFTKVKSNNDKIIQFKTNEDIEQYDKDYMEQFKIISIIDKKIIIEDKYSIEFIHE